MTFNLLDKRWIPVLYADGRADRVGIRKALTEAGAIRQIAASNPMDNVALLRLLLAVLQWCKPRLSDDERARLGIHHGIPEEWLTKELDTKGEPNDAFCLFGDANRFMQAPADANNERPVADLFHELPGDSNVTHFRHIRDYRDGVCPGCIAIGLARLPIGLTRKGSGKRPGINGDPPVYFVPTGNRLLTTLLMNWPFPQVPGDMPCWGSNSSERLPTEPIGVLEAFTWTSRQFRIDDKSLQSGRCTVCGEHTTSLVIRLHELNQPNGRSELSRSHQWRDPHVAYNQKNKAHQSRDTEKNLPGGAGQWRECLGEVIRCTDRLGPDANLSVLVVGLTTRIDKSVECWSALLPSKYNLDRQRFDLDMDRLDKTVSELLDPHAELKGKRLTQWKARHPLRVVRHHDRPLSDSVRCALADRLPMTELGMSETAKHAVSTGDALPLGDMTIDWEGVLDDVVRATTPGSALRRRKALLDAHQVLSEGKLA